MRVGVIGATSFIGQCLLHLPAAQKNCNIVAFSRRMQCKQSHQKTGSVKWQHLQKSDYSLMDSCPAEEQIPDWICLAPIWVLPDYFSMLSFYGANHIVVLSSTSRFSKKLSSDPVERTLAQKLTSSEDKLVSWARAKGVAWTILRPTMIYGLGKDKTISVIIKFIRRFSFFLLYGNGKGLRQPIHVSDVATSCFAALREMKTINRSYNLSGGEILTYHEMVRRIFSILDKSPRFLRLPPSFFRLALNCLRLLPRFQYLSFAMVERMNQDLVFEHKDACRDFNFSPRPFIINREDIPA